MRSRRQGYVLVVTLGLLVLSASLMVAISRAAFRRTTAAKLAADDLQHRWGVVSCRTAILPYSEQLLLNAEVQYHMPVPVLYGRVQLGGETFDLALADELAKANVNLMFDHTDRSGAEDRLRQSLSGTGLIQNIRLRPGADVTASRPERSAPATQPGSQQGALVQQWISGYGQIFIDASPVQLLSMHAGVRPIDLLTCWGGGTINIRRISPEALRIVAGGAMSGVDQNRLLTTRNLEYQGKPLPPPPGRNKPAADPVVRLLQAAGVDGKGADKLPPMTMNSQCHSIWIMARDKRRTWHYVSIADTSDKQHPRTWAFDW